jgi:RNA polymerase sigma factor (TIGR02999 family)
VSDTHKVTLLLHQMRSGDSAAADQLIPLVYRDLKRIAARCLRSERPGGTLQPTALVHEAYLRIAGTEPIDWHDRGHFFAVAARQMRRILVDHARRRSAEKRGAGAISITLSEMAERVQSPEDLLTIDLTLSKLESLDPGAARIVEMRYFSGLTEREIADVLGVSERKVRRDWEFARAWLFQHMRP